MSIHEGIRQDWNSPDFVDAGVLLHVAYTKLDAESAGKA